jgi:hypothetical protein
MRLRVLDEPDLEFRAGNRHIDPRFGLTVFGPADADAPTAPTRIAVGLIGSSRHVNELRHWLSRCREPIDAKATKPGQENLHAAFPGFTSDGPLSAELVFDDALTRVLPDRDLRLLARADRPSAVTDALEMHAEAAASLDETGRCHVIVCARPDELPNDHDTEPDRQPDDPATAEITSDETGGGFHDRLKARGLNLGRPIQLIRQDTWTGKPSPNSDRTRALQDEATRAWNLHTALYYKAGGTPWRMPRHSTDLATCYIGVSFYRADEHRLHTAVAQVFNERGDGVVVRGGLAKVSKTDKQPHLGQQDAETLLVNALAEFRRAHGHAPARIVMHKTSRFNDAESEGFGAAADSANVGHLELIWVQRRNVPRLFRDGQLPPLRGTTLQLDDQSIAVYTRGSIEFFRTYPGMYVPQPLLLRTSSPGADLIAAATDTLALSKMNWNNAQLDERDPLTLRTAARVGDILKHLAPGQTVASRYAHYM